jgi:hypothetical protein
MAALPVTVRIPKENSKALRGAWRGESQEKFRRLNLPP